MGTTDLAFHYGWQTKLKDAIETLLQDGAITIDKEHTRETPERFVKAIKYLFKGCLESPEEILAKRFPAENYKQMIAVKEIVFYSTCAHHLLQFAGTAFFAYIPDQEIVGISKIPRLIHCFARRPQVQENLTEQIVDSFFKIVDPSGCGLVMRAWHSCMMCRGIEEPKAYTETTALRGCFTEGSTKDEFITAVNAQTPKIWG